MSVSASEKTVNDTAVGVEMCIRFPIKFKCQLSVVGPIKNHVVFIDELSQHVHNAPIADIVSISSLSGIYRSDKVN